MTGESLPPFERPNGALMRTGSLTYLLTLRKHDGGLVSLGTRAVSVSDGAVAGTPGWLIVDARRGSAVETTDSVYLARADLTPQRWTATIGRAQLAASFSRDTMFAAIESYQGRASFAVAVPPGSLLSAGMVERVIELLPLRVGYHAGASLLLIDGTAPRALPVEILVEREERVQSSGRDIDCLVVAIRAGAAEQRLWVSKDGSRVVRTEQVVAEGVLSAVLQ